MSPSSQHSYNQLTQEWEYNIAVGYYVAPFHVGVDASALST